MVCSKTNYDAVLPGNPDIVLLIRNWRYVIGNLVELLPLEPAGRAGKMFYGTIRKRNGCGGLKNRHHPRRRSGIHDGISHIWHTRCRLLHNAPSDEQETKSVCGK